MTTVGLRNARSTMFGLTLLFVAGSSAAAPPDNYRSSARTLYDQALKAENEFAGAMFDRPTARRLKAELEKASEAFDFDPDAVRNEAIYDCDFFPKQLVVFLSNANTQTIPARSSVRGKSYLEYAADYEVKKRNCRAWLKAPASKNNMVEIVRSMMPN